MRKGTHFIADKEKASKISGIVVFSICLVMIVGGAVLKAILYPDINFVDSSANTDSVESKISISTESTCNESDQATEYVSTVDKSKIVLVNRSSSISSEYVPDLVWFSSNLQVSRECADYLKSMLGACEIAGMNPAICSAYRSYEDQSSIFNEKVDELMPKYDYNEMAAYYEAQRYVAMPGCSEHQLGLAVDIVDIDNQNLEEYQEDTPTQIWLINNSWKYGFILRYPEGTDLSTGVTYEPWHYRFVGVDAAKEIHEQGICLEEYLR